MMTDKDLTDGVLDEIIAGAKTSMEQYLALSLKAERAANRQQNQQQNIPENIPVNTPCKEAPEHIWLQTAGVWPENGEFSELTWCSDNQHDDDTLYVRADVVSGNSPVIPDGWVACSERMPENKPGSYEYLVFEGLNNRVQHDYWNVPDAGDDCQFTPFWNHYGRYVTHWMPLPAAPQKEVKP
ncbi:TPA: DUF551 domain-containing protein [Enterobacter asburiae]|nr:DUF551 domain-containing protein [Enterobacter asburiae]